MTEVTYVFGALEERDVQALMRIGTQQQLQVSDQLITEGTYHDAIYLVLDGELSVSVKGHSTDVAYVGKGEIVGEMSLLESQPASATLCAINPVTVQRIPRDALEENLAADPGLSARFYRALGMLLSHRLRATLDPEEVHQNAIEAGLVVHRAHPLNAETPVPALMGGVVMPNARFYIRNHFQIPNLGSARYRLAVSGLVRHKLSLSLRDLMQMPSQTFFATLECAGNGRTGFDPPIPGEKWALGAVSTAEWTGVPLKAILERAGIEASAREVLFRGADRGTIEDSSGTIRFERSLPLDEACESGAILAYVMNGEPLPIHHGFPLRLLVPGWYAVASVKWLTDIDLIEEPFAGHFQTEKYWYEWQRGAENVREPVTRMCVRALITEPTKGSEIERGDVTIRGVAWSGVAPIERVEVNTGGAWHRATLIGAPSRQAWQRWELVTRIDASGPATLRARAMDAAGRIQPDRAEWNRLGYGNNSIQEVAIRVNG
jgi:DMSO/TMAO reductase YedYZ molybdopterin-dependent catalytic subunit